VNAQAIRIVDAVALVWGVPRAAVTGDTRPKMVASARKAAYWIARNEMCWSFPFIGQQFARNHSTIISGVDSFGARLKHSEQLRRHLRVAIELCSEDDDMKLRHQFEDFHARNPVVYTTLVRLARRARDVGRGELGIACLWERMRWELFVETDTPGAGEPFKLNNNHRAFYAREIMQREPDLDGFFRLRESEADQ
jgi:hypothetical protein